MSYEPDLPPLVREIEGAVGPFSRHSGPTRLPAHIRHGLEYSLPPINGRQIPFSRHGGCFQSGKRIRRTPLLSISHSLQVAVFQTRHNRYCPAAVQSWSCRLLFSSHHPPWKSGKLPSDQQSPNFVSQSQTAALTGKQTRGLLQFVLILSHG